MAYFVAWINQSSAAAFVVAVHLSILVTYVCFILRDEYPSENIVDEGESSRPLGNRETLTSLVRCSRNPRLLFHVPRVHLIHHHQGCLRRFDAYRPAPGFGVPGFEYDPKAWFVLAMIALQALSAAYAVASPTDIIGTVVISWVLYGIQQRQ